ncbi:MAG: hypothetical protein JSU82_08355 [Rhodospirillales bacterium]|nr:MAG: hypothetical protein JSU82_08355 [Rhodospirillales bacterium]
MGRPITLDELTTGVFVAWRLFLGDAQAVALLDDSRAGARKSFWCAALILPPTVAIWALQHATASAAPGNFGVLVEKAGLARTLTVLAVFYVIGWTAWPVLMHWLAGFLGAGRHYFRYLAAYNWSATVVVILTLLYAVIDCSGVAPKRAMSLISLAVLTVMWIYHWFILRRALDVNGGLAAVLVAAQFSLSVLIEVVSTATVA